MFQPKMHFIKKSGLKQANTSVSVPPSASNEWAIKHKRNRKTTEAQARSNPFSPILGLCPTLGTIASGNFFVRLGSFSVTQGWQNNRETKKMTFGGMFHLRTYIPFCEQPSPSYWRRRSNNTPENFCLTHTHYSNVIRCVPLWAQVPLKGSTNRVQNQ